MNDLLFEICTEELPAGYIQPALNSLKHNMDNSLKKSRIEHGPIKIMGTPRRLTVHISDMASEQKSQTREETGPPQRVAYEKDGTPKVPAIKFAEKWGQNIDDIFIKKMPKGDYLCLKITDEGQPTETILKEMLPSIIDSIPFPKTMHWADFKKTFARPVVSLMCLLDNTCISFKWGHMESGKITMGHRFMHPQAIEISSPKSYISDLEKAHVIVDIEKRKKYIQDEIVELANKLGGTVKDDPELLDIVTNLVEFPASCSGSFEDHFLEVPPEVLICAMRVHQKYFAVTTDDGKLMPCFIAVNNTPVKDMALVARGHERVLRARLSDARFFFMADLDENLDNRVEKLKGVLFQAKLGTIYDKTIRIQKLSEFLADKLDDDLIKSHISRAAWLSKSDLVSQVVNEFPSLQGIMGRVYAQHAKEDSTVAAAIQEHYQPTHSGGELPKTFVGAIIAIADKIDTICGCFGLGLKPTGAADPYALRRQGIGVIRIMQARNLTFSLENMVEQSLLTIEDKLTAPLEDVIEWIMDFFKTRMINIMNESGISKDIAVSVLSAGMANVPDIWARASALEELKKDPDFESLASAFKRVGNIIKKVNRNDLKPINPERFEHDAEKQLYETCTSVESEVFTLISESRFDEALKTIASIRGDVDRFFDDVLVMADDEILKNNRLKLLVNISMLFERIADFSQISN
ncbi:Glycyl-tRNA synthetase beta subunit [Candidatus Magnetomorum sp. HK-1]|nr:Glycyl-tRNA synthetase beta subunit [Candidatus Magnetomorum sp. HK-1]